MKKNLSPLEWVKLAVSKESDMRPVMCALHVADDYVEGCDTHRVHRWLGDTQGFKPGLFHAKNGITVDGTYPNVDQVMAPHNDDKLRWFDLWDRAHVSALGMAAMAASPVTRRDPFPRYMVELQLEEDGPRLKFNGGYIAELLAVPYMGSVQVAFSPTDNPTKLEFRAPGLASGVAMCIRPREEVHPEKLFRAGPGNFKLFEAPAPSFKMGEKAVSAA